MAWLEKRGGVYWINWRENGRKQKRTTGFTDKLCARAALSEFETAQQRGEVNAVDRFKEANARPLADHVADYIADLRRVGRDELYAYSVQQRLAILLEGCGWKRLTDITADSLKRWQALRKTAPSKQTATAFKDKGASPRTLNQFRDVARAFCNWAAQVRRGKGIISATKLMPSNPLANVSDIDETGDVRRARRALSEDEMARLLKKAGSLALVYRFILSTGLRRAEVRQLVWGDLHLGSTVPYVLLRAATTKSKRGDSLPLRSDLAKALQEARGDASDTDRVFARVPGMKRHRTILERAGIPFEDAQGRRADFHALRHSFGTMLSKSGVSPREAMELMRHTDLKLTMRVYTDPRVFDLAGAVEKLPAISATTEPQALKATGTTDTAELVYQDVSASRGANWGARTTIEGHIASGSVHDSVTSTNEETPVATGVSSSSTGGPKTPGKVRHLGLEPKTR